MARKSLTTLKSEKAVAKGLQGMLMSDTQPETDKEGMTWFNKTNEVTYIAVKNEAEVIEWKPMSGGTDTGGGTGGGASVTVSETAPASPSEGDLWMDSSSTQLYIYYNDGTTSQWVQTTATPTSAGASISVSSTPPALPTQGQVWWDSETANLYVAYNDGTGTQWIQSSSSPVTPVTDDATVSGTAPADPVTGMLWYDTGTSELKVYDGTEWKVAGGGGSSATPAPTISSVFPNNYNGDTGTEFTITGTNYTLGMTVDFITASGTEVRASIVTVLNQAQISVTTPQAFLSSDGPLDVKVNRPDGETVTLTDAIQTGGSPIWSTAAGTLYQNAWPADVTAGDNSYRLSMNVDEIIEATDPDGQDVTYSVESGSLPTGVSLNSTTGTISGTLPSSLPGDQTYTFSAGASDTAGNLVTRNFSIIVKNSIGALYDFSGFTFTSGGTVGKTGPNGTATMLNAYDTTSNPWLNNSTYYNCTNWGRQTWVVPFDGTYRITITGARGSYQNSTYWHGLGAKLVVDLELFQGRSIYMVIGQCPITSNVASSSYGAGGGGGGTFMYEPGQSEPILVAGGGGGAGGVSGASGYVAANGGHPSYLDVHGQVDYSGLSTSYGHRWEGDGASGACTSSYDGNPGAGGTNGAGGQCGGSGWSTIENTGGGAGWSSDGQPNSEIANKNTTIRGKSLAGNFEGGTGVAVGGFGGGGASGPSTSNYAGGAGGGGYSGGGGAGWASDLPGISNAAAWGGGGGSYITDNTGTVRNGRNASVVSMQEGQAGTADGCGLITIEPL